MVVIAKTINIIAAIFVAIMARKLANIKKLDTIITISTKLERYENRCLESEGRAGEDRALDGHRDA
jgi:hypothetical protein